MSSNHISQEAARELLASLIETRNAAAALLAAVWASGHGHTVLDELEPGHEGFGVRANDAIAKAQCTQAEAGPFESETEIRCPTCGVTKAPWYMMPRQDVAEGYCRKCDWYFDIEFRRVYISPPLEQPGKRA